MLCALPGQHARFSILDDIALSIIPVNLESMAIIVGCISNLVKVVR